MRFCKFKKQVKLHNMFERHIYQDNLNLSDFSFLKNLNSNYKIGKEEIRFKEESNDLVLVDISLKKSDRSNKLSFYLLPSLSVLKQNNYGYRFIIYAKKRGENNYKYYCLDHVGTDIITNEQVAEVIDLPDINLIEEERIDYFGDLIEVSSLYIIISGTNLSELKTLALFLGITFFSKKEIGASLKEYEDISIDVPAISQIEQPKEISHKICAPMSVSMVLQSYGLDIDPLKLAQYCYAEKHDHYGIWPNSIWAASKYDIKGIVTALSSYDELEIILNAKIPVIVTLTYKKGELTDAAVPETSGHLMVVTGISDDGIIVNDPGAKNASEVTRVYNKEEFGKAWLETKFGICYIFERP